MVEENNYNRAESHGHDAHHHGMHGHVNRGNPSALISSLVPSRVEAIADIGCGSGFYSKYLLVQAERVYCIDIDESSLLAASEEIKSDRLVCINAPASNTNLPSKSVNIVFMADSFHDMDNKPAVVEEISRILSDDGRIIIIDWKKDSDFGPPQSLKMSQEDYLRYFKGFVLEKSMDIEPQHYCMVLKPH
jgi:ubiquinone/menaquinone biosynthesis C-methylase UbiE